MYNEDIDGEVSMSCSILLDEDKNKRVDVRRILTLNPLSLSFNNICLSSEEMEMIFNCKELTSVCMNNCNIYLDPHIVLSCSKVTEISNCLITGSGKVIEPFVSSSKSKTTIERRTNKTNKINRFENMDIGF